MTTHDHGRTPEEALDLMLRPADLPPLVGLSPSTIRRHVARDLFPRPVRLSAHAIGWPSRDVRAWLASRAVVEPQAAPAPRGAEARPQRLTHTAGQE